MYVDIAMFIYTCVFHVLLLFCNYVNMSALINMIPFLHV